MTNYKNLRDGYLSQYFTIKECKCKGATCCGGVYPMQLQFLSVMDALRKIVGPLNVNSGFRCYTHNNSKAVGGSSQSYHTKGLALDVWSTTMTPKEIEVIARGLGLHTIVYDDFIHCDGRGLI
jgi:uncharacterized protein YcbK (DUF882 family)